MWIIFTSKNNFAIKVYAGGVNCITGKSINALEDASQASMLETEQDYVVSPSQRWLDGIATAAGRVRQFVAAPIGSGFSIEAQMSKTEDIAGLQFDVTPCRLMKIFVKTVTGRTIRVETSGPQMSIKELRTLIINMGLECREPIAPRLECTGRPLDDGQSTLCMVEIRSDSLQRGR
jgi:hypothetical protein